MANGRLVVLLSVFGTIAAGAATYPVGDLNTDRKVDFADLRILADSWLDAECENLGCRADLDGDGRVNLADFSRLAGNWQANVETPAINEFMASNGSRPPLGSGDLLDADGESSDWIELYNPTDRVFDLGGWYLTDDAGNLTKWQSPSGTKLNPNGYLVVFASGKNRTTGQLHTNFQLAGSGGYLALVKSDGRTVADEFGPSYPEQLTDISYGLGQSSAQFVTSGSTVSYHVPSSEDAGRDWTAVGFNDDSWPTTTASLGFSQTTQLVGRDIGNPAFPGGYDAPSAKAFMIHGDGADIGGSTDSFYYVYMPLRGDGELTAFVMGMVDTDAWAKAGVMIRETLVAGSRHASEVVSPRSGTAFLRRTTAGGATASAQGNGYKPPYWVRITRRGNVFSGYYSPDGVNWAQQGTEAIAMAQDAYIGLCVSSHAAGTVCTVVFDNVTFGSQTNNLLRDRMLGVNSSLWIRAEFDAEETAFFDSLRLQTRYEDGFVAWLNGTEVARGNFTGTPRWDSAAGSDRSDLLMGEPAVLDLSRHKGLLRDGRNVLAIQGLNENKASSVFLIAPELDASGQVRIPQYFITPTPGRANISGAVDLVATPELSHERGFYSAAFLLSIFCDTPGATIRYTTNGTKPTEVSGLTYTGPVTISTTTCLRAAAFKPGWMPSPVQTHTYIFPDQVLRQSKSPSGFPVMWGSTNADYEMDPDVVNNASYRTQAKASLLSLPTMSVVSTVDNLFGAQGLHADPWGQGTQWERPVSVEWINPDGTAGFHVDAGMRVYGGAFRGYNLSRKKSFRLLFKRDYGPTKLDFPLFEEEDATTSFDMIVLRAGANDAWNDWGRANTQYIIDEFMRRTQLALGQPAVHGTFVHLYLNGLYWGLYNLTERPVESFCAAYFGGDAEDWDAVNRGEARGESNLTTWNAMLSQSRNTADPAGYQRIQGNNLDGTRNPAYDDLLDVDNYIDYMFCNFWGGTGDWPGHNYYAACRRPPNSSGFKFFNWDSEGAIIIWSDLNANVTGVRDGAATPYATLRQNPEFCLLFADHVQKHLFNEGPATSGPSYARYKKLADQVELAIIAESARWGDQSNTTPYTLADWRKMRDYILGTYMPQRSAVVLSQLKNAGLYPATVPPVFNINGLPRQGGVVPSNSLLTMSVTKGRVYYTTDGGDPRLPAGQSMDGKIVTLLKEDAPKRVLVPSTTNGGDQLSNIPAGFQVTFYKATVVVDSVTTAEAVIANRTQQATVAREQAKVINYFNSGSAGNFENDRPFPGTTFDVDVEDFVVLVTGKVMIPATGEWTFGVNSDDGFSLTLTRNGKTYTSSYPSPRGPGDTLTVFNIAEAGAHDLRLVFYERGGGSELELFASRGNISTFNASRFHLVGDVTAGGLQVGEGNVWYANTFNDSSWTAGAGGVGYEASTGNYRDYFRIDVQNDMYRKNGSCYIRIPFTVTKTGYSNMMLKVRYDDGFVAYLNGAEIARQNLAGEPQWNSVASTGNADEAAVVQASFDVSDYAGLLWEGANLLAIHGLNTPVDSSDFLISVELAAGEISQGAVSPKAIQFGNPVQLTESTHIKARTFDGRWSALNETVYAVGPVAQSLRISEIMYHPLDTGSPDDPNTEYIELTNIGAEAINLNLVRFANGVDFTFPSYKLAPGGYCLVVKDAAAFGATYGTELPVAGQYLGSLNNAGERLELRDAVGTIIHDFRFEDKWFDITDGLGFSLTLRDPKTADPNALSDKNLWRPSAQASGTPGFGDAGGVPEPGAVVINELLANSQGVGPDWIELYNATGQAIDIGGWFLSDDADNLVKYQIAAGTSIPASGYLVFDENRHFGNPDDPGCKEPFALSRDGETVYLHSGSDGVLTGYSEQAKFGASEAGVSLGRHHRSTGDYDFVALTTPTPGQANADPTVGPVVINEIMYNPGTPADAEYVELLNVSGAPVTLYDTREKTSWRFTDDPENPGVELLFAAKPPVTLAVGEFLLLVKDVNLFSTKYTVPAGVQVLAWGKGNLANGNENVQLSKPGGQDMDGTRHWIRVDRVTYSDGLHPEEFPGGVDPWPVKADGQGSALVRINPTAYGNDPANWKAATPSPGSAN